MLLVSILFLPFLAQANQIDDRNVYEVRLNDAGTSYYAERTDNNESPRVYKLRPILLDGAGAITVGAVTQVMRGDVTLTPSTQKIVREALQAELDRQFRTVGGQRIPKLEYDLAERARNKALELEERLRDADPAVIDIPADIAAAAPNSAPNPLLVWGPQIGLVLAAAVLVAIIVKLVLLNG
ncbi:MAG: hypothetical protein SGI88_11440 [Candidatus Hydrogenedentes bacterium]|nr:hypothetical protein [Candidatus Hydrogenedentota bacterium]